MDNSLHVAILFGGRSSEHEISLCSAWNLINEIDKTRFSVIPIGISKAGRWYLQDADEYLGQAIDPRTICIQESREEINVAPGDSQHCLALKETGKSLGRIDVVFPMLHGPNGEDGKMQGLLEQLQLPYVGCGVLSSSICMDKDIAKTLMRQAGIPTSDSIAGYKWSKTDLTFDSTAEILGTPLFIKPANLGSSVGISKVNSEQEFADAIDLAFEYDTKIIIEQFIPGREIEVAILGNENPIPSVPGEYVHSDDFFSYETKYMKADEVRMLIPARDLTKQKIREVQQMAIKTYKALGCEGMARIDVFISDDGALNVNEVNTIPGFTNTSMYPSLMATAGYNYPDLIAELIGLALARAARTEHISTAKSTH